MENAGADATKLRKPLAGRKEPADVCGFRSCAAPSGRADGAGDEMPRGCAGMIRSIRSQGGGHDCLTAAQPELSVQNAGLPAIVSFASGTWKPTAVMRITAGEEAVLLS